MAMLLRSRKIILSLIFFLFLIFFLQIHHISVVAVTYQYCNNNIGNYPNNSNFQSNLNSIISAITTKINAYGFYSNTLGDGVDRVNAIGFCRGDIDIESCRNCLNDAARELVTLICTTQMEGIRWYEQCMFRYSNNKILGVMSTYPKFSNVNTSNMSNPDSFVREIRSLAGDLAEQAYNGTFIKYAGSETTYSFQYAQTVFGLMQCSPDITPSDCKSCLQSCQNNLFPTYNHVGARWVTPSCNFRYETYRFLNNFSIQLPPSSPPPPPLRRPPSTPPPGKGKSNISKKVIASISAIVALLVLISLCVLIIRRTRRQKANKVYCITGSRLAVVEDEEKELKKLDEIRDTQTRQYDFSLIKASTEDFSIANKLGRGGFGVVYKGVLPDGKAIAVKRLSTTSGQGEAEFMNEVISLAKLQHKCLVKLLGFCLEQTERLLIYDFMANGSLDKVLFDPVNRSRLDWERRYKIIKSVARGILYLHEDSHMMIIHRDLKASNILLDEEMNAKISDFGMARLFVLDEGEVLTQKIAGTFGYMAPEYAMHGMFSVKSDVYSYGILLLEIICGKKTYPSLTEDNLEDLPAYAYKTWKEDKASDLIDPMLTIDSDSMQNIMRCVHVALLCVQEKVGNRPTMAAVIHMLQSSTLTLPTPSEPGFFVSNSFTNTVAPNWSAFTYVTNASSSNSQSKPMLFQSYGHNNPSSNANSHKRLHSY